MYLTAKGGELQAIVSCSFDYILSYLRLLKKGEKFFRGFIGRSQMAFKLVEALGVVSFNGAYSFGAA